jgi:hypothetical protein
MVNGEVSFCRIENKYLIPEKDIPFLSSALQSHLDIDPYALDNGHYQVNTIYFDNKDNDVVDRSLAHPTYKEKLRLRSYGGERPIYFIEFKNKLRNEVFKVRILLSENEYLAYVFKHAVPQKNGDYKHDRFLDYLISFDSRHRDILPRSVIQYDRGAFVNKPMDKYIRVTIDTSISFRRDNFHLNEPGGRPLLGPGLAILEIKIERALPLWLAETLNDLAIYRDAFSKYGTSYVETKGCHPEITLAPSPERERTAAETVLSA